MILSALIALIGLLVYAISTNGKAQEIRRIAYAMSLLAFLFQARDKLVGLLR